MNMFKKNGGFTLVELIVVIAILAILAAVAVPAYSGYIEKANEAADYTQLDAIKTAATFAYIEDHNEANVAYVKVVPGTDASGVATVTVSVGTAVDGSDAENVTITDYYKSFPGFKSKEFKTDGAYWTSTANKWQKNS